MTCVETPVECRFRLENLFCFAGIIVATGGEPLFHIIGFLAALSATCGRAFKSVLQVGSCKLVFWASQVSLCPMLKAGHNL